MHFPCGTPNKALHSVVVPFRLSVPSKFTVQKKEIRSNLNPLIATLKPQTNGPLYSNTVIGTLAVDRWAVTFGTERRGLGGAAVRPGPSWLYQM